MNTAPSENLAASSESDSPLPSTWECFLAAIQFLTRIQVTLVPDQSSAYYKLALQRGVLFFPVVGGLIGGFTAILFFAASQMGLSALVAALLAVGIEALLTGAFHEDAFADTCDALGGGWSRERVLEIMKDSRLGTYGTLGLVIGVGLRVTTMAALIPTGWSWTLATIVAASTLGRLAIIGMMVTTQPVTDRKSQANNVSANQTQQTFLFALFLSFPFLISWLWSNSLASMTAIAVSLVVLWWFRGKIMRRVGGTTGDLLGSCSFLIQLVVQVTSTGNCFHG